LLGNQADHRHNTAHGQGKHKNAEKLDIMNDRVKYRGRGFAVVVSTVILSGCAMPVPFQIASWAIDGISYLTTDKTIADHGLSMVTQQDCAIWRGIKGDEICSEIDDAAIFAIASTQAPTPEDGQAAKISVNEEPQIDVASLADFETAAGSPETVPAVVAKPIVNSKYGERLMIAGKRVWSDRLDADHYYVIGSYSNRGNARRMVGKYQDLGPAVMASRLDGLEVYRVAVGPFSADQTRQMRVSLKLAGINNAWAMRVDHREWTLASPKELAVPAQSIAEIPQGAPAATTPKAASGKTVSDEIAETPAMPGNLSGQSSELIDSGKHHLVIGSFSKSENARNFAKSKADLSPRIMSAETTGGWRYRVVIGPYAKAEGLDVRRTLAGVGIDNVWALNLPPVSLDNETLLADVLDAPYQGEQIKAVEIAETPAPKVQDEDEVSKIETPATVSHQEMSWGVNLTEYIFDMFRSSDAQDVVGVVSSLES